MLTPALKVQLGVNASQGAVVVAVDPTSPAEQAGLQRADAIAAIDGTPIKTEPDLPLAIDSHKPGDTVTLTVDRGGQQMDVKVTLGSKPSS
jgi:S1-C subfamily serine protease